MNITHPQSIEYHQFWLAQVKSHQTADDLLTPPLSPSYHSQESSYYHSNSSSAYLNEENTPTDTTASEINCVSSPSSAKQEIVEKPKKIKQKPGPKPKKPSEDGVDDYKATKNLTKNYGNAIVSFASSKLALPYLATLLPEHDLNITEFKKYIKSCKLIIQSIDTFRNCFLVTENDSSKQAAFKRVLQAIAIIFIKCFSVNWITHGRVANKMTYLKWRGRILRRIQSPETFTYLKFQEVGDRTKKTLLKHEKVRIDIPADSTRNEEWEHFFNKE